MENKPVFVKDETDIDTPFVQVEYAPDEADTFFIETAISFEDAIESSIDEGV